MKNTITLTMGDWSHDGHGWSETVAISCNLDSKKLGKAYEKGCKIVGFDMSEDVATDYEDSSFPNDLLEKLEAHGFKKEEFMDEPWKKDKELTWHVSYDGFWQIWLFIAKLGDPSLKFEEIERTKANINIGGYGMFNS